MRPWTTRTVQAAVVAAGFAAVGTGAANAAENPELPKPDLSSVPDHVGFFAPVNACQMQEGAGFGPTKAPCADAQLHAGSPNLVKQVGVDITTTAHGVAGELRDGRPLLAPGKPDRVLGHVATQAARVEQLTRTRPTIGGSVLPDHLGVVDKRVPNAALLDAEIGPRTPGHQGVSAVDTALDLTAAQGFSSVPLSDPGAAVAPLLRTNPLQTSGERVTLPKVARALPVADEVPAVSELDAGAGAAVEETARQLTDALPHPTVHRITGQLPDPSTVTSALR
ncbi:hypothetical protein GCM10011581_47530 [Saccharopolyspora subtropica]|uniref:Secreted protein n=1 Tax=Saccharopolyspora thermophila TaxID=89367 RepID=A0A917K8I1_9PSEU|nr:hypothetical protein [Saccharopolyspora subtropica]GGJ04965.1 hypothetical protein GCM10011581_47530 [Saccharopolyspora subtropica]